MQVQNLNITRGAKTQEVTLGITEENKTNLFIKDAEVDAVYQQSVKAAPVRMVIDFNEGELNGEVISISTTWKRALESNAGLPIHSTGQHEFMSTNHTDIKTFVTLFGSPILKSMLNGYVRSIKGHNDKPVYDLQGQVIQYTPEQEAEAPNYQYNYVPLDTPEGTPLQ